MKITYRNLSELDEVAKKIIKFAGSLKVWTFEGTMGVGKTTLIQALARQFSVIDTVQSPTYAIVHEYLTEQGEMVYHFDFYRLQDETEALDLGYEEYFYSGGYCWIEWPSKIPSLLPETYLEITISLDAGQRTVELRKYEQTIPRREH